MSDLNLHQTNDGGDIDVMNGVAALSSGLEQAAYLSLFGGNSDDSGGQGDDPKEWWGNLTETEPAKQYRSETQNLVRSLPINTANLQRIEDAAARDLAWMTDELATSVEVEATIPALNKVNLAIVIVVNDRVFPFSFVAQGAQAT